MILDDLGVMRILSNYGRAELVGSVAFDLIVKRDIDIHLLLAHSDLFSVVNALVEYLLNQPKVGEVRITDWRIQGGIKIGVDAYPAPSGSWSLDIWVTDKPEATAFDVVREIQSKLTAESRAVILNLKGAYHRQGLLRDGISLKIYKAVLDGGVWTLEEFNHWLKKQT